MFLRRQLPKSPITIRSYRYWCESCEIIQFQISNTMVSTISMRTLPPTSWNTRSELGGIRQRNASLARELRSWTKSLTGSTIKAPLHHVSFGSTDRLERGNRQLCIWLLCMLKMSACLGRVSVSVALDNWTTPHEALPDHYTRSSSSWPPSATTSRWGGVQELFVEEGKHRGRMERACYGTALQVGGPLYWKYRDSD